MVDLDLLRRKPIPYLGWYIEGAPMGVGTGKYVWYAHKDAGAGTFKVTTDVRQISASLEQAYEDAIRAGLAIAKGKVFLGTWRQDEDHQIALPHEQRIPTAQIRSMILRGLHRLYEEGFKEGDSQVDIEAIAMDLGVPTHLVERSIEFLYKEGFIEDPGTAGTGWSKGDFWLSSKGVQEVEAQTVPVEAFLQELHNTTLSRLSSLDPSLSASFEKLRELASSLGTARQDLVGFAAMVRDFVQDLTDRLYSEKVSAPAIPREQTINKVKAITAAAGSAGSRRHVRALAQVVETHWRRLNDVQQRAVHSGTIESQRLFAYTLLFVADLFDVADSK